MATFYKKGFINFLKGSYNDDIFSGILSMINDFGRYIQRKGYEFYVKELEKGVNYAKNRKDTVMIYHENGYCSFSNNLSEKTIHSLAIANKN